MAHLMEDIAQAGITARMQGSCMQASCMHASHVR